MVSVRATAFSLTKQKPLLVLGASLGTAVTTLWREVVPLVSANFDVVGYDLPGHGSTPVQDGPFTMGELAAAVVESLRPEFGDAPFYFSGDSIGGAIGQEIALAFPDRLQGAVLCCTAAKFGTADSWNERIEQVRNAGTASLVEATAGRWFTPDFREKRPDVVATILDELRYIDDAGYMGCCGALAGYDVRERLGAISAPIVTIAGADDPSTPPEVLQEIADGVPNSSSLVFPNGAHLAPVDHPAEVAAAINGMLS